MARRGGNERWAGAGTSRLAQEIYADQALWDLGDYMADEDYRQRVIGLQEERYRDTVKAREKAELDTLYPDGSVRGSGGRGPSKGGSGGLYPAVSPMGRGHGHGQKDVR